MKLGWYTGQFLPKNAEWLDRALQQPSSTGYINSLLNDAAALIKGRPSGELHSIALHAEAVIMAEAKRLARLPPDDPVQMVLWRAQVGGAESLSNRTAMIRRAHGDIDLWLAAGAEAADVEGHDLPVLPGDVIRAAEPTSPISLPQGSLTDRANAVLDGLGTGDLSTGQAAQLMQALGALAKVIETDELAKRIEALEARTK